MGARERERESPGEPLHQGADRGGGRRRTHRHRFSLSSSVPPSLPPPLVEYVWASPSVSWLSLRVSHSAAERTTAQPLWSLAVTLARSLSLCLSLPLPPCGLSVSLSLRWSLTTRRPSLSVSLSLSRQPLLASRYGFKSSRPSFQTAPQRPHRFADVCIEIPYHFINLSSDHVWRAHPVVEVVLEFWGVPHVCENTRVWGQ